MATGQDHGARTERQHRARERLGFLLLAGGLEQLAGEHARLGQVRGEHGRARQDLLHEGPLRVGVEQARARLGDHHRIDDDGGAGRELIQRAGDRERDGRGAEHPDLDRVDADVGEHRTHLREHDLRRDGMNRGDANGVLGGDRGDRARTVHAAARERLQIGLDAGTAAGVRAGDRERDPGGSLGDDSLRGGAHAGRRGSRKLRGGKIE